MTLTLKLPRPHPAQYQVLRESKRFNVLCCGRRWGKTTIAIDRLVRPALRGKPVAWFAPIYKDLSEVWRAVLKYLDPVIVRKQEQDHWAQLIGGGTIECWGLDKPGAGRGRAYARVVIDEAAKVPKFEEQWNRQSGRCSPTTPGAPGSSARQRAWHIISTRFSSGGKTRTAPSGKAGRCPPR